MIADEGMVLDGGSQDFDDCKGLNGELEQVLQAQSKVQLAETTSMCVHVRPPGLEQSRVAFTQRFSGISEARFAASEGTEHHEQQEVGGTRCFRRSHFPGMLTRLPCCCQEGVGGDHPSAS